MLSLNNNDMKFLIIAAAASLLCAPALWAQAEEKHPIDKECEKCHSIEANQTTMGMIDCEAKAAASWDKELNKNYNALLKTLSKAEQEKLRASQRKWIAYRDAELDFSNTMYRNRDGSMWGIVAASRHREITRTRALELKMYMNEGE